MKELIPRPRRPPDLSRENRALTQLVLALAESPATIPQTLANTILDVLDAGSAGVSALPPHDGGTELRCLAVAGAWKGVGGVGTPPDPGPSSDVLGRNASLLFRRFERGRYPLLDHMLPAAKEALFVPFSVGGKPVGTVWAIGHDEERGFDAEDLRQLEGLGRFAAATYQTLELRNARESRRAALNLMEDAVIAREAVERLNLDLREGQARLSTDLAIARRLCDLSGRMIAEGDINLLYDDLLAAAMAIMDADTATLQEVDGAGRSLRLISSRGFGLGDAQALSSNGPDSTTSSGLAQRLRRRVIVSDVETSDLVAGTPALSDYRRVGVRAVQSTPLMSRTGALLGMVSTHWRHPWHPPDHALRMLDVLARQAADLIEQRRAQSSLRESEERFRALADNIPQLAWIADSTGHTTWNNRRWHDYVGTPCDEAEGSEWWRLIDPQYLEGVTASMHRSIDTGESSENTFPLRGKDGTYRWFLSRAVPIRDAGGTVRRWFGTHTDITEQRAMAEELRVSVGELATANRLMSEFVASLAHELRGPLAPIVNALHLMRESPGHGGANPATQAMLERQVRHMVHLVDDLLDASRVSRGTIEIRPEPIDLMSAVQLALDEAWPAFTSKGVEVVVTLPSAPIICNADATRIAQVVSNLLSNACKFTGTGGRVEFSVVREPESAVLRVRDTGIGMEADHLPHIFELFMQVGPSLERGEGGLGIGLTLVKDLVERHGGTVEARSEGPGRGSEFEVRLPLGAEPATNSARKPPEGQHPVVTGRRILVVDDNRDSAESMACVLELSGNEIRTAHEGISALKAAAAFRPDIMLLDVGLPGLNGHEVARRIRAESWGADIMLVAVTGWGQEEDRRKSREAGFDAHVVKPVRPAELMRVMAAHHLGASA